MAFLSESRPRWPEYDVCLKRGPMNGFSKFGLVLAGYVAAAPGSRCGIEIRLLNTQGPDADASAGMYAFGDAMLFLAVFGFAALFPTGLALCFLRTCRWFWTALSIVAPGDCHYGRIGRGGLRPGGLPGTPPRIALDDLGGAGGSAIAGSTLLAAAFALCGLIAPARWSRWSAAGSSRDRGCGGDIRSPSLRIVDDASLTLWHTKNAARRTELSGICWVWYV